MNVKILLAVALLASLAGHAAENSIAIVGATVIHPERELPAAVERDRTVLITGNRIVRIGPRAGTRVPAGATRINGKGKWVVPGLVDAHVHFFQSGNLYTRPDVADFNAVVPYVEEVARNKARRSTGSRSSRSSRASTASASRASRRIRTPRGSSTNTSSRRHSRSW